MTKKVAAINDLSGAGRCSLTVALPILSTFGVHVFPMPTAILSNQTGYDSFYIYDFTDKMDNFTYQWKKMELEFDGIYTGFIASCRQVDKIEEFIKIFKKKDTLLIIDPIMGDDGAVYPNFNSELREKITKLAFQADIITPNLTEFCILTGTNYKELISKSDQDNFLDITAECGKKLIRGNVKRAVITGIRHRGRGDSEDMFYNIVISEGKTYFLKSEITGGSYSGTGDILSSIICAMSVKGYDLKYAVEVAVKFIGASIKDSYNENTDRRAGVNFEKYLWMLNGK